MCRLIFSSCEITIIVLNAHARLSSRGHAHLAPRGLAHFACPNIFPSPIFPSSFQRRGGVSVHIQETDDDDNPVAAISIHWEYSPARRNSTALYNPGIYTSVLHRDATSSFDKTEHLPQCRVLYIH